jgi:hypothetical protein
MRPQDIQPIADDSGQYGGVLGKRGGDGPRSFNRRQTPLSLLVHTTSEASHTVSATREQGQRYPLSSPLHLLEHRLAHDGRKNDHTQEMCHRARCATICFSLDPTSSLYEGILAEGHRSRPQLGHTCGLADPVVILLRYPLLDS